MNHHQFANRPPMGWNSWDCYGASVREEEVRGNADYMAQHLKEFGWEYVVVDIQWYEPGAHSSIYRPFVPLEMDEYSRLIPAESRFPSAKNGDGFKRLADYIHGLGLKFGIHIMRGIPRQAVHANTSIKGTDKRARDIAHTNSICPWNTDMYGVDASKEGAQAYYNSIFDLYAEWEVDFVKVDDSAASRLYDIHVDEIKLIRQAIDQCGRPMVLSLSPGPAPLEYGSLLVENANMWRMTDDLWDHWPEIVKMFDRCEKWAELVGPGHWPDCDMLPLGHIGIRSVDGGGGDRWTRLTSDEQLTMMSLWCMFRSPLMFGGELRDNDEWTLSLLTNQEVLELHRNSYDNRLVTKEGSTIIWAAKGVQEPITYLALFNTGEESATISVPLEKIGVQAYSHCLNLWTGELLETNPKEIGGEVPRHGVLLVKLF
ncbi:glycoside hydrolase family 27 protein [Pullulanibacillus sp. KACC 23026]|uniref:glycoside hydrolase family 27 protein n=1 Tax=Pullulanibacillus sp. KACC 23026 TaxID=3028315 RepID=UPI0023B1DB18|nr:glycoside hydrolase family 27 protein [Pullulanibacillus sp. KACC 23026]WEG11891.1 glycoside hydrolase family 27 protein [Pullulanibacillus sp. KACC 23026]